MSLLTCCPSCGTQFRVVSDQLRISDGWVRCGRCQEVFDASQSLQEYQEPEPEPLLGRSPAHGAPLPTPPAVQTSQPPQPQQRTAPTAATPPAPLAPAVAPPSPTPTPRPMPAPAAASLPAAPTPSAPAAADPLEEVRAAERTAAPASVPSTEPTLEPIAAPDPTPAPPLQVRPQPATDVAGGKPRTEPQLAPLPVPSLPTAQAPTTPSAQEPEANSSLQEPVLDSQRSALDDTALDASAEPMLQEEEEGGSAAGERTLEPPPAQPQPMLLQESQALDAPVIGAAPAPSADIADPLDAVSAAAYDEPVWDEEGISEPPAQVQGTAPVDASPQEQAVQNPDAGADSAGDDVAQVVPKDDAGLAAEPASEQDDDPPLQIPTSAGDAAAKGSSKKESSPTPSFVRKAQRQERWRRPWVRALLALLALVLPALLLGQIALHERNALAARVPALQPALEALCQAIGCQVAPPQNIAMVVIAGSSFTQESTSQRYRLDVSLRNQSTTLVATPALELTLTDASDQPLARKVFLPADLHSPQALGARAEWNGSFPVQLQELPQPVVGYRVQLFYP